MNKPFLRTIARVMLLSLAYQLVFPLYASALTTGPSQPEMQSFEPVGTTEMVDMFTGDFTYNIPLLDVEGYPVNIAYHGGVGIEQEASWVGLGWNINPGEINRGMRGLPDDFNGEVVQKKLKIEDEVTWRFGTGANVSFELFGWDAKKYGVNLSLGLGGYLSHSNYKGVSLGMNTSATISVPVASAGIDMGVGSQNGADIDVSASLDITRIIGKGSLPVGGGTGFNSRSGMKDISLSIKNPFIPGHSFQTTIPIGLQNYVPVVTNPSSVKSFEFQARFGGELFYTYPNAYMSIQKSVAHFEEDGSRPGYGYLYAENAPNEGIMDFSRQNDGYYNTSVRNLPLSSMTYDIYAVSGHGTGGVFRPFRNDIGSVYDPEVKGPKGEMMSALIEGGIGNLFEVGTDLTFFDNEANSGPWNRIPFRGNEQGSLYEKVYFKQAGELTFNHQQGTSIHTKYPVYLKEDFSVLSDKHNHGIGNLPAKYGGSNIYWSNGVIDRSSRANLFTYLTAEEASIPGVAEYDKIRQFEKFGTENTSEDFYNPTEPNLANRFGDKFDDPKGHHIGEVTQTLGDGRRYVYGIPAMNHVTREATFSVSGTADASGLIDISSEHTGSVSAGEKYYSSTVTPAYAHSYLLSSVLSADYVDVLGDGPTDDDLGGWVKINYTLWNNDYRWRVPYLKGKAQYNPGFNSDPRDDKGNIIVGSRQQWHIRTIESKNFVAEFYVSERHDGKGSDDQVLAESADVRLSELSSTASSKASSYKLDSIKLFNKHDRFINGSGAVPIKTVIFKYADPANSLCRGIPNAGANQGKLTLEKIYTRYGSTDKNLLNPYEFKYENYDDGIHRYNHGNKDRWGNFKNGADPALPNYEFPYVKQDGSDLDADRAPYDLTEIKLPSGGLINIKHESDDYSFVQDRRTMQMFKIHGVGNDTKVNTKNNLYEDLNNVNDYIYFKRIREKENPNLSLKDNYLEKITDDEYLYYSFNMDITGRGQYDFVKGYARVLEVDSCSDDSDYAYVRIKKERAGNNNGAMLHPATVYGINLARNYLPHRLNKGFDAGGGFMNIINGLKQSLQELITIGQNPIVRYIETKRVGKNIRIDKSWVRLTRPGLTKKGGGTRVRELTLNDNWTVAESDDASYGKVYDYTITDGRHGVISSGVASYEPLIGGDENPFKLPVPYTSDAGRLMPAVEFFQEEPFGELFFPPPLVGYSQVRVKSIHMNEGRSSQSIEEHKFYTAKEFPIRVDYTDKEAPPPIKDKGLRRKSEEVKVYQGYLLQFNDMHGKPKMVSNYVLKTDGTGYFEDKVSSVAYNYQTTSQGELDNNVNAVYRKRGTLNEYELGMVKLGEEVDFTVDTRERYNRSYRRNIDISLNVVLFAVVPVPIPSAFFPDKEEVQTFRSMVSTKVIQKYGVLKSVETFDNGAKTTVENMVYDAESGKVLLTKSNNSYNDQVYDVKYPAYWAHEGMGPAYYNTGYEVKATSFKIDHDNPNGVESFHGLIYLYRNLFSPGDELLLTYKKGENTYKTKVWVIQDHGAHNEQAPSPWFSDAYNVNYMDRIRVALRASRDNNGNHLFPGMNINDTLTDVTVKVLRPGPRNMLDKTVWEVKSTSNPASSGIQNLLNGNFGSNVLHTTAWEYSDTLGVYGHKRGDSLAFVQGYGWYYQPEIFPVNITELNMKDLNPYVLGHLGNYKVKGQYFFAANRNYAQNNIRYDGKFSPASFLQNHNGGSLAMGEMRNILTSFLKYPVYTPNWRQSGAYTYDGFGNVIQESDGVGKFVSAQYGYNKSLPTAVTSNAKQRSSSYEGFEDYSTLVPKNLYNRYKGTYFYHSPFASVFNNVVGANIINNGYGQSYYNGMNLVDNGDTISKTTAHTGNYSLRLNSMRTISLPIYDENKDYTNAAGSFGIIRNGGIDTMRKYVVSVWVKPVSQGGQGNIASNMSVETLAGCYQVGIPPSLGVNNPFSIKSGNIEGWYLISGVFRLTHNYCSIQVKFPGNAYYDDLRILPMDAQMKSFVYDPVSFKLTAELDENNFATFYEYDQEGLLIRVKKETEKGIMTIKENRQANKKN